MITELTASRTRPSEQLRKLRDAARVIRDQAEELCSFVYELDAVPEEVLSDVLVRTEFAHENLTIVTDLISSSGPPPIDEE